jgi:hypothetical protein
MYEVALTVGVEANILLKTRNDVLDNLPDYCHF